MRSEFVRIYKSIHTWTGILTGMALFIAFYAGALTVFKEPLARWVSPPSALPRVALADAQALIVRTLAADPASARDFTIYLDEAEHLPARMAWQVREAEEDEHDESAVRHYVATLDERGAAQVSAHQPSELPSFIDVLHRVVGLPVDNDPNRWVMGIVATLYALALVSGVVVLIPSLVKDLFALRVDRSPKRMWLDAHNVVGLVSLPFHVVMALTAVVFAYHDGIYYLNDRLIHDGRWATAFQRRPPAATPLPGRDPNTLLPPASLVESAKSFAPGFEPSMLQYQQVDGPHAVVRVWGKDAAAVSPRARGGFLALDPYSGKVINSDFLPGRQSTPNLFVSSFFALHMAAFGGTPVQWMYFVLGLAGAWLFYSGNLLWVETRRRKQSGATGSPPVQRLDVRLMASATVGVCLGCICGISAALVGAKWLHAMLGSAHGWIPGVYYLVFFASVGWAFAAGAARAAVHLLWLASVLTVAIPLTSLAGWSMPGLGVWGHAAPASLGVDLTALVGALGFAAMARATSRRAKLGRADSVWSQGGEPGQGTAGSAA